MNMKQVAQAMNRLQKNWDKKADELAAQAREGLLTADEAAKCLAGADLKFREALREEGFNPGPGGEIFVARQEITRRGENG